MEANSTQHQAMNLHHSLEEALHCPKQQQQQQQEKKLRPPHPDHALRCPRCDSTNTKFCYYNNYSLSQPRYFCKGCRRYWTQGGSLRNVPVGGGCRKNKRSSSSSSSTPSSSSSKSRAIIQDHLLLPTSTTSSSNQPVLPTTLQMPPVPLPHYDPNDLTLAYAGVSNKPPTRQPRFQDEHGITFHMGNPNSNPSTITSSAITPTPGFLDILRGGFPDTIQGGFYNLYSGGVEEVGCGGGAAHAGDPVLLPYGGELGGGGAPAAALEQEESCKSMDGDGKMMMCMQWGLGGGDHGNMGMDPGGRDYWGNLAPSWHGLVNSSLM